MSKLCRLVMALLLGSDVEAMLSQVQQDAIVAKHNELRSLVGAANMVKLTWSPTLASTAQQLSSTCPDASYGEKFSDSGAELRLASENVAWWESTSSGSASSGNLTRAIQQWYERKTIADGDSHYAKVFLSKGGMFFGTSQCSGECIEYAQVVWAAATRIGCGISSCPFQGTPGYQLRCRYGTTLPGKQGEHSIGLAKEAVFLPGRACSHCPDGFKKCTKSTYDTTGLCMPAGELQHMPSQPLWIVLHRNSSVTNSATSAGNTTGASWEKTVAGSVPVKMVSAAGQSEQKFLKGENVTSPEGSADGVETSAGSRMMPPSLAVAMATFIAMPSLLQW